MLRLPSLIVAAEAATCRRNFANNAKWNTKKESHYEVLNVSNDCTKRDIRNAYLKLSKQYHPDVKSNAANAENTARFVQITEAYQTLIKTSTRKDYDASLIWNPGGTRETIQPWEVRTNYSTDPGPYYGIKGISRVSNWQVALFLISLGILGAFFGFSSAKHSFELNRHVQDEISAEANSHHAAVVADAQKYGNQEQMRRMVERLAKDPLGQMVAK
ncbi:dnaJ-like protein 60 [Drosophila grimshawi]|uniref:GH21910 n=1 Tax=Drosophila grimshawi TaxID=7222 RepID=B4J8C9_DROGR|nr:dnaJ-like protein 60 [Drosophila grimshawi]EDW02288.1 GH21910 [Drosophila grimshawi]